jgi:hypothetical protein
MQSAHHAISCPSSAWRLPINTPTSDQHLSHLKLRLPDIAQLCGGLHYSRKLSKLLCSAAQRPSRLTAIPIQHVCWLIYATACIRTLASNGLQITSGLPKTVFEHATACACVHDTIRIHPRPRYTWQCLKVQVQFPERPKCALAWQHAPSIGVPIDPLGKRHWARGSSWLAVSDVASQRHYNAAAISQKHLTTSIVASRWECSRLPTTAPEFYEMLRCSLKFAARRHSNISTLQRSASALSAEVCEPMRFRAAQARQVKW